MAVRKQKLFVIRRLVTQPDTGEQTHKFYSGSGGWTPDISQAWVCPESQVQRKIEIDIGMRCEALEVLPVLASA